MSIVNKLRKDVNGRYTAAHGLMQQSFAFTNIVTSHEYLNSTTIDKNYVNTIINNINIDFKNAVTALEDLDARLSYYNTKQLNTADHGPLLLLDQEYVIWCDNFMQNISPAFINLVQYISQFIGVEHA